jgi:hypothetical protein
MKNIILPFILLLYAACSTNEPFPKNKLHISENGFEFKLFQRNQIEIPSDSNNVFCYIDDITAGQTNLILKSGNSIILDKSIRKGDVIKFSYNSVNYTLTCTDLINKLIGEDYAFYKISALSKTSKIKDESAKIEQLLKKIESSGITFIRNGTAYNSVEAAKHLRAKLKEANGQIKTHDQFIKNIGSYSSMTGKAYLVKLKNGKVITAEEWYKTNF